MAARPREGLDPADCFLKYKNRASGIHVPEAKVFFVPQSELFLDRRELLVTSLMEPRMARKNTKMEIKKMA